MKPCLKKWICLTLNLLPCHLRNRVVPHFPEAPSTCLSKAPVNILPQSPNEKQNIKTLHRKWEKNTNTYMYCLSWAKEEATSYPIDNRHVPAEWLGWKLFLDKMISFSLLKALGVHGRINHLFTLTQEQPLCKTNQKAAGSLRTDWQSQRGHLVQTLRTAKQHIYISANNLTVCLDSFL